MVDKTLRYTWLCVCYVDALYAPICLVTLPSAKKISAFFWLLINLEGVCLLRGTNLMFKYNSG
jgi:hypothetical protein